MGDVWRASVVPGGEEVAVKLLRGELSSDPEVVAQFVRERTVLLGLHGEHVVCVRDLVVENDDLGIVMDLVEGGDLRRHLRAVGTLAPAEAVDLVVQVLRGIEVVHAAGVIHRDVKPENVLLETGADGSMVARLTDFGIARVTTGPSLTRLTGLIGTPDYMAPEVVDHARSGAPADLYATGVLLYELLTGHTPFGGGHPLAVLRRHLEEPPSRPVGCPEALWSVLASLLAKKSADRPASAGAAIALLEAVRPAVIGLPALPPQEPVVRDPGIDTHPGDARPTQTPTTTDLPESPTLLVAPRPRISPFPLDRRRAAIALTAIVALLVGWVLVRGRTSAPQTAASSGVQLLPFSPSVLPNGIVATRSWSYDPGAGVLACTLQLLNPATTPITGDVDEVVAKSLATSTASIRFSPSPTAIVQSDPVVRYHITLGGKATTAVHYDIDVGAGASRSRLEQWLADENAASATYQPTLSLAALSLTPSTLTLPVGGTAQVLLVGTMSDGTSASTNLLDAVILISSDPAVASVSGRTVTGVGVGTATLTAPAGVRSDPVTITVAPPPSGTSPTTTGSGGPTRSGPSSPGPTTHGTPRPTPTPTPTAPPPPTATPNPPTPTPSPTPSQPIPVTQYSCSMPANGWVGNDTQPGGDIPQTFVAQGSIITTGLVYGDQASTSSGPGVSTVDIRLDGPAGTLATVPTWWDAQRSVWHFSFGLSVTPGVQYTFHVMDLGPVAIQMFMGANYCMIGSIQGYL